MLEFIRYEVQRDEADPAIFAAVKLSLMEGEPPGRARATVLGYFATVDFAEERCRHDAGYLAVCEGACVAIDHGDDGGEAREVCPCCGSDRLVRVTPMNPGPVGWGWRCKGCGHEWDLEIPPDDEHDFPDETDPDPTPRMEPHR